MDVVNKVTRFWNVLINDYGDIHIEHWSFVKSPAVALLAAVAYLIMIQIGPKIMKNRKPFKLKWILVVYNFFIALFTLFVLTETVRSANDLNYNWKCSPLEEITTPKHERLAAAMWYYHITKYIEFLDTLFLILRKRDNQLTNLHIYHHFSIVLFSWLMVKVHPGGMTHTLVTCNTTVHVVMYTYYGLSALGPAMQKYLWWKKYLTLFQITQFLIGIFIFLNGWWTYDCKWPMEQAAVAVPYFAIFAFLFSQFYLNTYNKKVDKGAVKKDT